MVEDIKAPPQANAPQGNVWAPVEAGATPWKAQPDTPLARFLGGPPLSVFWRLFFLSLIVGALLMWLDIRPYDIFEALVRFAHRIWALGFDAIRQVGDYLLAGAIIVVPLWFVSRLVSRR
ncbi:MAG: DUF6460 domain-containing protein [Methylovirgula sp.]